MSHSPRRRVLLTQLPLAALVVVLCVGGSVLLGRLGTRIDGILRENYDSVVAMEGLNEALERIDSSFQFALAGREAPARVQYDDNWLAYREHLRAEQENITLPGEREAAAALTTLSTRYQQAGDAFYTMLAADPSRTRSYFGPSGLLAVFGQIKETSSRILRMNESNMEQASRDAKATATRSYVWFGLLVTVTALLAGFAAKRLEDQIRRREQAERKYRDIVENASVGIFQTTPAGRYIDVNPAMARMLGYASTEALVLMVQDIGQQLYVDPSRRTELMRQLEAKGSVSGFEAEYVCKDHSTISVSLSARAVRDAAGAISFYEGFAVDVTARRRAEERLQRMNRAYRALSSCNQLLIRAEDEPTWLRQICQVIVEDAGYRMCWVGYAEADEAKSVRPVAEAGFDEGYLEKVQVSWADTERGRGPTGTCIRTRATTISRNIAGDPRLAPWRAEALKRGYASSIALPLLADATMIGALTIYATEPDAFSADEVSLLTELSGDLAYGIMALRTRAARARAQEELRVLNGELEQRVIARTAELGAAREREMETGLKIQRVLLLDEPPVDVPGLCAAALTIPAQEIGGDFYGFMLHENQCLDVFVADVMGKGIPAALLSAAAKSHFPAAMWHLMSGAARGELPEPHDLVTLAHAHMARELIALESFVTLCYARIDRAARRLDFVDCGHTGILHARANAGGCSIVHGTNSPLGVIEGEIFDQRSISFDSDDLFLFFSDGVTEARDEHGELFGADRLLACVQRNLGLDPKALVDAVRAEVASFSRSSRLRDDLTCVAVKIVDYEPPLAHAELEISSDLAELQRARSFVRNFCSHPTDAFLDADGVAALELAVDEAVANIVKHAYGGRTDQRVHIGADAYRGRVHVRLRYMGKAFDRAIVATPLLDGSRDSGFGVFLIENSVDTVRYHRDELGRNCIDLDKNRGATSRS